MGMPGFGPYEAEFRGGPASGLRMRVPSLAVDRYWTADGYVHAVRPPGVSEHYVLVARDEEPVVYEHRGRKGPRS